MMPLNESIMAIVEQGASDVAVLPMDFWLKMVLIFGIFYLFNTALKTGGSILDMLFYVIGFIKWVIYKIMKKDI